MPKLPPALNFLRLNSSLSTINSVDPHNCIAFASGPSIQILDVVRARSLMLVFSRHERSGLKHKNVHCQFGAIL